MAHQEVTSHFLHPASAPGLKEPYTEVNITKKNVNKDHFLESLGLAHRKKTLVVAIIITRPFLELSEEEKKLLHGVKEACSAVPLLSPLFIFADDEKLVRVLAGELPVYFANESGISNVEVLSGVDAFLFPEKKIAHGAQHMQRILSFGGVVVAYAHTKLPAFLEKYNPFSETGNTFFFEQYDVWNVLSELIRVHEVYKFPHDWNVVRKRAMASVQF